MKTQVPNHDSGWYSNGDSTQRFAGKECNLAIGQVKDSELLDAIDGFGDSVYSECEVDKTLSQGLKTLAWGSSLDTVCMKARILMDVSMFPKVEQRKIKRTLIKASNQLQ